MELDTRIKLAIYGHFAETGRAPTIAAVAAETETPEPQVRDAFERLQSIRLLALEPRTREIRMAPPFSAVPTPFRVTSGARSYFANCVWDAYGIAAALHATVEVETSCGCCGEAMRMAVHDDVPEVTPGVAHFAVPAAHWWEDIVHT